MSLYTSQCNQIKRGILIFGLYFQVAQTIDFIPTNETLFGYVNWITYSPPSEHLQGDH